MAPSRWLSGASTQQETQKDSRRAWELWAEQAQLDQGHHDQKCNQSMHTEEELKCSRPDSK